MHGLGPCQPTTVTPDLDPTLRCKKHVLRFTLQLWDSGMLGMTSSKQATVSLFFVFKKSDEQGWVLMWVWDLRKVNL